MANENGSINANELSLNYGYTIGITTKVSSTGDPGIQPLERGFDNISESLNEVLYQSNFLSDDGWGSSYVTGGQYIVTLTGVRVKGDRAQDYIFSDAVMNGFGAARETKIVLGLPDGGTLTCPATLAKITRSGGAANQPTAISVEIHFNGKPIYAAPLSE